MIKEKKNHQKKNKSEGWYYFKVNKCLLSYNVM